MNNNYVSVLLGLTNDVRKFAGSSEKNLQALNNIICLIALMDKKTCVIKQILTIPYGKVASVIKEYKAAPYNFVIEAKKNGVAGLKTNLESYNYFFKDNKVRTIVNIALNKTEDLNNEIAYNILTVHLKRDNGGFSIAKHSNRIITAKGTKNKPVDIQNLYSVIKKETFFYKAYQDTPLIELPSEFTEAQKKELRRGIAKKIDVQLAGIYNSQLTPVQMRTLIDGLLFKLDLKTVGTVDEKYLLIRTFARKDYSAQIMNRLALTFLTTSQVKLYAPILQKKNLNKDYLDSVLTVMSTLGDITNEDIQYLATNCNTEYDVEQYINSKRPVTKQNKEKTRKDKYKDMKFDLQFDGYI